ncbi:hypothetical protein PK51_gp32 [Geobacillus phage vB_GthS_PK5.1]|nr:hypothetical protein PK51_gp32 [Geobacillus phage vB_GthS_PK5.1]
MNDKERLQTIKDYVRFLTFHGELGPAEQEYFWWLIEQVEQLQQENEKEQKRLKNQIYETVEEKFLLEKQFQRAQAKAERYEKALKEIVEWSGIASREYRIATKALEGKENE